MPNRLSSESSPYLRQHEHDPVDWYAWGEEALTRAARENKPLLLSVGYSACHWCHVMAHESFQDARVAAEMNRDFVCIKVDREERPDIDEIYMQAVQAFTGGRGGWPMTVICTPDGRPYFGGTYFPPERRGRMPSFTEVLRHASGMWKTRNAECLEAADQVTGLIGTEMSADGQTGPLDAALDKVAEAADASFDSQHGGFGGAPKFPPHGTLAALLAHHARSGRKRSLDMVVGTLRAMIRGGTWDHLAGGFARYSVDAEWRIPHFEKMLYDNAQLVGPLLDAGLWSGDASLLRVARVTLDFMLREMSAPGGGLCSAFDADSEGEEGKYYAWTPAELRAELGLMDGLRMAALCGVTDAGNFEHGKSVLVLDRPLEEQSADDRELLVRGFAVLAAARAKRVPPGRDDKVLTSWNGLAISALCRGAQVLGDARYSEAAAAIAAFLLDRHTINGRLMRTGKIPGFLDDHANLLVGLIDLWETTFELRWLQEANRLADRIVELFADEDGGLFLAGHDAERLVVRSKKPIGGSEPGGPGMTAWGFARLAALCDRTDLGEFADRVLAGLAPLIERAPRAMGLEAVVAAFRSQPGMEIGIVGSDAAADALLAVVRGRHLPFAVVARIPVAAVPAELPFMDGKIPADGVSTAYVCSGGACRLPVRTPDALLAELTSQPSRPAEIGRGRVRAPALPADPADWINSPPLSIEALRGRVVVLDFWTYCCINCMHVLPELEAIEKRFADRPVTVIGVHAAKFPAEQERLNVERAVARHAISHAVVNDPRHELWEQYAIRSWPTLVVLDGRGRVAWQKGGEVGRDELSAVIERVLAENAEQGLESADVPVLEAPTETVGELRFPGKVHVAGDALYIADSGHHRLLAATLSADADGWPVAAVQKSFGDGVAGRVDGDVPRFRDPQGISAHSGELWVADTGNHALRVVDLHSGSVRTVAGTGQLGRGAVNPDRPLESALRSPWDVIAIDGAVFVAMAGTHQIWIYLPEDNRIGPFVGSGVEDHRDGPPEEAALAQPSGLAMAGRALVWADSETSSIRLLDLEERVVRTICGRGLFDWGDRDGTLEEVELQHPLGVAIDEGRVLVADTYNGKVRAIDLGEATSSTLASGFVEPGGLAVWRGYVLVADTGAHRIAAISPTGEVRSVRLSSD